MNPSVFFNRCIFLCLIFVIGLSGLSVRLIYLHVVKAKDYQIRSANIYKEEVLLANRGCIVDCDGQLIARDMTRARVAIDKKRLHNVDLAAISLANKELREMPGWYLAQGKFKSKVKARAAQLKKELKADDIIAQNIKNVIDTLALPLGMKPLELRKAMKLHKKKQAYVVIKRDLPAKEARKLEQLLVDCMISPSVIFEDWQKRWYLMPTMAATVVGYVGEDGGNEGYITGRSGIEYEMNATLAGRNGSVITHRNKYRPLDIAKPGRVTKPEHGGSVQLTLNMGMQAVLEEELNAALEKFSSKRGAIVLMNPKNGAVMAMASRPTFNLQTRENIIENSFDSATQAIYEPGSTFKIISIAGAIDQDLIELDTVFDCAPYRNGSARLVKDYKTFGALSVREILAKSSNVGSYKVALELGPERFFEYVKAFGFGAKTNILMPGESAGVVNKTDNPTDFSRISYGYGVSVTPLQVACAYSAIANDGMLMKPRLLKLDEVRVRRVIKAETAQKMRKALATVVDEKGTARRAKVDGFTVAGKTGTTVKIHPAGGYYNGENDRDKRYTTSFAGMLPAGNPEFVCVVVIDDPKMPNSEEGKAKVTPGGGNVAAPIFSKVATRVANLMGLNPTTPDEVAQVVVKPEL